MTTANQTAILTRIQDTLAAELGHAAKFGDERLIEDLAAAMEAVNSYRESLRYLKGRDTLGSQLVADLLAASEQQVRDLRAILVRSLSG